MKKFMTLAMAVAGVVLGAQTRAGVRTYALSLKGTNVKAEYEGQVYTKSVSLLEGETVKLTAPESYVDARENSYLFQCWTPSKALDFGTNHTASAFETTLDMPASALVMTATYVKESEAARITLCATAESVKTGERTIEPDLSQFYWSVNGKVWYRHNETAVVKKGTYAIRWKSASKTWAAPTARESVTVGVGEEYSNVENPAAFTFVTTFTPQTVVYEDGDWQESAAGGTATVNPTDGRLLEDKSITFTAKAKKGYVFVGWQPERYWDIYQKLAPVETDAKYTTSSFSTEEWHYDKSGAYVADSLLDETDHTIHLQAVYRPLSDYTEEGVHKAIAYVVSGDGARYEPSYDDDPLNGTVKLQAAVGCETSYSFANIAIQIRPATFKLTGKLPAGLKFTADGEITGTPKSAGTSEFKVSVKDPAGNACSVAVTLVVRKVDFAGIAGEYRALLSDDSEMIGALLEMSVTAAGKVSAKITTPSGGTVSIVPSIVWVPDSGNPEGKGTLSLSYCKDSAKGSTSFHMDFGGDELSVGYEASAVKNKVYSYTSLHGSAMYADPTLRADEDFAALYLGQYYTLELKSAADVSEGDEENYRTPTELMPGSGYLTVTTDAKGAVKIAGKLADGEKLAASTVLLPSVTTNGLSARAVLFAVPSSYKKKGYLALQLAFSTNATGRARVSSSVGTWITPPLLDAISGCEECAEEDLFLPGKLALTADGALYSKLEDLTNYYLALDVSVPEDALLEYSYTEEGEKMYVNADTTLWNFGLDSESGMLTGDAKGKITVGRSASPWRDSEGYYNYDVTAAGDEIPNPAGLTIAFKPATGIFSGAFKLYYDYETTKMEHKVVSCSYEGVLINDGENVYGVASAPYAGKYTYQYYTYDARGNEKAATKTYTKKCSIPVQWLLQAEE